jgi:hypothetical protein
LLANSLSCLALATVGGCQGGVTAPGDAHENSVPTAEAGPDQSVTTGSLVTLDATASSDADADPLTYSWAFASQPSASSAALSNSTEPKPTFAADLDGAYVLKLVVNDGTADSAPDTVTITATTANAPPVASAGIDQNVATGSLVSLDGTGSSDANSDPLTYLWSFTSKPAGSSATLSSVSAAEPTFTADLDGAYILGLVVNDGMADSAPDTVTITATRGNVAPVASAGVDQSVVTGSLVTLDATGSSDADADPLTYSWTFVSKPSASSAALSSSAEPQATFTADLDGAYVLRLVVNDGTADSAPDTVMVTATTANAAPVADAGADQDVLGGATVTLDGSASYDLESESLAFAWAFASKPAGSNAQLSDVAVMSPTFEADKRGTYVVQLVVSDAGASSAPDVVTVTAGGYVVGGAVAGLTGSGLVLQNNGGDDLAVSSDGEFSFPIALADTAPFDVSVKTNASTQACWTVNGSGTIAGADISTVAVYCGDAFERNETSDASTSLGTIGTGGSATVTSATVYPAADVDWYRVWLDEPSSELCAPGSAQPYRNTVTMTPPAGMDYDVQVCFDPSNAASCTTGASAGSATETVQVNWNGVCGANDSRYLYVRVYAESGGAQSSEPYSLSVDYQ